jgi:hypothetical protein
MKIKLNKGLYYMLMEALRRYKKFNYGNESMTTAWTGLAYPSHAKSTVESGYMRFLNHRQISRCRDWLILTEKGAKIVSKWMEDGYTKLKFIPDDWEYPVNDKDEFPPKVLEIDFEETKEIK